MKRTFLLPLLAIVLLFATPSCKQAGKTGLLVPKDAIVAVHVSTESLTSKLSWEELKQTGWFKKLSDETNNEPVARELLDNPSSAGIDIKTGLTFFLNKQGQGGYACFQGGLKDAAAFEATLKKATREEVTIQKKDDLNIVALGSEAVLTWNNSRFIFLGDAPLGGFNPLGYSEKQMRFDTDSLIEFAKSTYKLKGKELLDSDSKFADLVKSNGDIHFYFSSENYYNGLMGGMLNLFKASELMEGNVVTGSLNFDNGKISVTGKQYYGKELAKILEKYPAKKIDGKLLNRLPSGDLIGFFAVDAQMDGLVEILKLTGVDGVANGYLGKKDLTLQDLAKAFTGEFAMALTGVERKTKTIEFEGYEGKKQSFTSTSSEPNYVVGVGIRDKNIFDKLFGIMREEMGGADTLKGVTIRTDNNWFVASDRQGTADAFLAGNNKPTYAEKLNGHTTALYLNFQALFNTIQKESNDLSDSVALKLSMDTWQDIVMYGDQGKGSGDFTFEVNMVDKNTNSLKQINQYVDRLASIRDERRKKLTEQWDQMVDTTAAVSPALQ